MIDEAFGRGSDESARFGLELSKRMNLQLLIVTPLQKIHIIEPYVVPVAEFARLRPRMDQVFIVENDVTALAFPPRW